MTGKVERETDRICSRGPAARIFFLLPRLEISRHHAGIAISKESSRRAGIRIIAVRRMQNLETGSATHNAPILSAFLQRGNSTFRFLAAASVTPAKNFERLPDKAARADDDSVAGM
ncbi:hypothetical protein [Silvibacterium acidisoli]|uniref:hypothetical protein n=1 Tax=Acidobacteriaceae bacterium ZG23-2 TaxID=2883246 RepID=UPI00406D109D